MSFKFQLLRNLSPTNRVSKNIQKIWELDGTLRKESSIIDPVIVFEANNPGFQANDVNYLYAEELKRYYFITNIISKNHTLWEIHAHVDVLMSFKDQILKQKAVVARQTNTYNLMLDDGFFMAYSNPKIQTKLFSVPDPFETQEFVLIVAGS